MTFENVKDVKEWFDTFLPQIDVKKVLLDVETGEASVTIQFKKNLFEYITEYFSNMLICLYEFLNYEKFNNNI